MSRCLGLRDHVICCDLLGWEMHFHALRMFELPSDIKLITNKVSFLNYGDRMARGFPREHASRLSSSKLQMAHITIVIPLLIYNVHSRIIANGGYP